jgi:glutamate-1-semialdehyde aminotransferase
MRNTDEVTTSTRRSYANSEQQYAEACTVLAGGVNRSYEQSSDAAQLQGFLHALQDHGVRPTSRGTWFLSTAHTDADVEETIRAAEAALG